VSPLRRRMIEDMRLRNFSACTERSYVHYVAEFARHFNTSPEHLGLDDIRNYQPFLTEQRQLSAPSINSFVSAVQFLYTVTLEMPLAASFKRLYRNRAGPYLRRLSAAISPGAPPMQR
jgi:integrase/recombinase XerD